MSQLIFQKNLPIALVILDGFGIAPPNAYNAISQAHTPTFDYLFNHYPHANLAASGTAVGLMPGIMGNSEVGHLTIGAGRIIPQDLVRIHNAIDDDSFFTHPLLGNTCTALQAQQKSLHIMGLLSDGNVHSSIDHLFAYIKAAHDHHAPRIYIHAFLDGRDTPPQSAALFLEKLDSYLKNFPRCSLASITGRMYAMDRNKNWQRTERTYRMLTEPCTTSSQLWHDVIKHSYEAQLFDEYIEPTRLDPEGTITHGDGIIFFNFRADRAQQLTEAFIAPQFCAFKRDIMYLSSFITPVNYASKECTPTILYPRPVINDTLKEWVNNQGYRLFTCAEQEKYAHVTYFFNGGEEKNFDNERLAILPSKSPASFADHPEMAAKEITATLVEEIHKQSADFYIVNYANADMVGHTGNLAATIKAVEILDQQIAQLYKALMAKNGTLIITADHGNAEEMFDELSRQPKTAHTTNHVPFILAQSELFDAKIQLPLKGLADIAPFIKALCKN